MKRDMDLIRQILLAMEAEASVSIPGYDPLVIGHHAWLMEQGDLITAATSSRPGNGLPVSVPLDLAWKGHEFLDAVRNETVWAKVKTVLKDKGISPPFTLLQQLALKILAGQDGL